MLWSGIILTNTEKVLGVVLQKSAPAREFATPYLLIRGFAFLPSIITLIGFSAFRGKLVIHFTYSYDNLNVYTLTALTSLFYRIVTSKAYWIQQHH